MASLLEGRYLSWFRINSCSTVKIHLYRTEIFKTYWIRFLFSIKLSPKWKVEAGLKPKVKTNKASLHEFYPYLEYNNSKLFFLFHFFVYFLVFERFINSISWTCKWSRCHFISYNCLSTLNIQSSGATITTNHLKRPMIIQIQFKEIFSSVILCQNG